jgi:cellulose synthase (UDP-forming)
MEGAFKNSRLSILVIAFFVILTASGMVFSMYLLYLGSYNIYLYAVAVLFLILSVVSGFFNIFTVYSYYRSVNYGEYIKKLRKTLRPLIEYPTVAVVMPVFNEDASLVKSGMTRLKSLDYPKDRLKFYLLDDSTDPAICNELKSFSKSSGVNYIHRQSRKGFKAGALNNFIKKSSEEFMAVFDYDEYLTNRRFLLDLLPYFNDKSVSFIQTEKRYFKGTFFSDAVDLFDAFFFRFIQPSRAMNNTAVFAGSCGIIRKSSLEMMGGFPEYIIEDTFFSFESDMHNFKSLYVPKVYAYGKPIRTFSELSRQQWRYNYGDTQFLMYFMGRLRNFRRMKKTRMSVIDYMVHGFGLNYVSTVLIMFTITSALVVFVAKAPSSFAISELVNAKYITTTIELLGIGAFISSILAPMVLAKIHFKSLRKGFMVLLLNFSLSFVRLKAAVSAAANSNPSSGWTRQADSKARYGILDTLRGTFPETMFSSLLFILGLAALVINNVFGAIWLLWYAFLYLSAFAFFYIYG